MSYDNLPSDCNFVGEGLIDTSQLERLFDDVVSTSDPEDFDPDAYVEEPDTNDTQRFYVGVINCEEGNRLIGYASATMRDEHATVDLLVVSPLERGRGIGGALSAKGIELLEAVGAKAISFVVEHESINMLVPGLMDRHGFRYDEREQEYVRRATDLEPLYLPNDFILEPSVISIKKQEVIGRDERIAFKKVVTDLIQAANHFRQKNNFTEPLTNFTFYRGHCSYTLVEYGDKDGGFSWQVRTVDDGQLVEMPDGLRMITEKLFTVTEPHDNDEPTQSTYYEKSCGVDDGELNERHDERIFTQEHFQTIMDELSLLTTDHLEKPVDNFDDVSSVDQE